MHACCAGRRVIGGGLKSAGVRQGGLHSEQCTTLYFVQAALLAAALAVVQGVVTLAVQTAYMGPHG